MGDDAFQQHQDYRSGEVYSRHCNRMMCDYGGGYYKGYVHT